MEKYFIAGIGNQMKLVAFMAESKEKIVDRAKECGINVQWVIEEVNKETYNEWKGAKVEIP